MLHAHTRRLPPDPEREEREIEKDAAASHRSRVLSLEKRYGGLVDLNLRTWLQQPMKSPSTYLEVAPTPHLEVLPSLLWLQEAIVDASHDFVLLKPPVLQ